MATTVEAIYENGVLKPLTPTKLKEQQRYKLTLEESNEPQHTRLLAEPHPILGRIVFNEDPLAPLDSEDWPMDE
jgi:predicted DNA-binding antitoxin AbrB/MazE fold protein